MGFPEITFRVCETRHCPLYRYGDIFSIAGIAIDLENEGNRSFINTTVVHLPPLREMCTILSGDLTRIIISYGRSDKIPDCMISCSGCTGSLKLEHIQEQIAEEEGPGGSNQIGSIIHLLSNFSFFRNIDEQNLNEVVRFFTLLEFERNEIIIRKGEAGGYFYIVVAGRVDILNDTGIAIATLGRGDVFGEMSLICEEQTGATVQVREPARILAIKHCHFKKILLRYPSLQLYFTRLLARRLTSANQIRSEDYASAIIGKLEEIPPEALFQTLHINNKTGILTITGLPKSTARFSIRHGALIKASYGGKRGEEAFYEVLRCKQGRFRFTPGLPPEDFEIPEIGYFMKLLMEGLQRIDEEGGREIN